MEFTEAEIMGQYEIQEIFIDMPVDFRQRQIKYAEELVEVPTLQRVRLEVGTIGTGWFILSGVGFTELRERDLTDSEVLALELLLEGEISSALGK